MPERKFDKFADLGHLFSAATNIIISNLIEVSFLILALNGLAFTVDDGILCNNAELGRIHLNYLELHLTHATSTCEEVALADWTVSFPEVRGEEDIEESSSTALNGVGKRKNCDTLGL